MNTRVVRYSIGEQLCPSNKSPNGVFLCYEIRIRYLDLADCVCTRCGVGVGEGIIYSNLICDMVYSIHEQCLVQVEHTPS